MGKKRARCVKKLLNLRYVRDIIEKSLPPTLPPLPPSLPPSIPTASTTSLPLSPTNIPVLPSSPIQCSTSISEPVPSTSGIQRSQPIYSSSDEDLPISISRRIPQHSTPYAFKYSSHMKKCKDGSLVKGKRKAKVDALRKLRKMSDKTLERELLQTTLEDSQCPSEEEASIEDPSEFAKVSPISKQPYEKEFEVLFRKVRKNLDFDEIQNCLEKFPSIIDEETTVSYDDSILTQSPERELPLKEAISMEQSDASSSDGNRVTSCLSNYNFFLPEDTPTDEYLSGLCKNYKDAVQKLLNANIGSQEEETTTLDPIHPEPPQNFDRQAAFKINFKFEGLNPSVANTDPAIIQMGKLDEAHRNAGTLCQFCDSRKVKHSIRQTEKNKFFCQILELKCGGCQRNLSHVKVHETVTMPTKDGKTVETDVIAMQICIGALEGGVGYTALQKILSTANLPMISERQFNKYADNSEFIIEHLAEQMKEQASKIVTDYYIGMGQEHEDGLMNIQVSFDGTWLTRGFGSLIGLGFVVEVETGIILDYHILSKYCNKCHQHLKKEKNMGEQEIKEWKEAHKPNCDANYDVTKSSSSMEAEIAEILFKRSVERGLRYITILSDEDSSTYNRLKKLQPYGDKYPIQKQNCLNHINKKIYRRLDNIRTTKRLGGKGEGKLTKKTANVFANFYRVFVKKFHNDHNLIKKNILASVFHHAATDEYPFHQLCPKGKDSWCKYQRDIFNKIDIPDNWHKSKENRKYSLGKEAAKAVLDVMIPMTSPDVLSLVSKGTQNVNESLHSRVWSIIPKSKFRGTNQVKFATARVALIYNCGEKVGNILGSLGIKSGKHLEKREVKQIRATKRTKLQKRRGKKPKTKVQESEYNPGAFAHDKNL